jgi:hypothetical protein
MVPDREKLEHTNTKRIDKINIFYEYFVSRGGVYMGDSKYLFVTDSVNFREYIGHAGDQEYIDVKIEENKISCFKYEYPHPLRREEGDHLLESKSYYLDDLIKRGKWD